MAIGHLDKLLDGSELRVVAVEEKNSKGNKLKIGIFAAVVLAVAATGYNVYNNSGQIQINKDTPSKQVNVGVLEKVRDGISGIISTKIINPIYDESLVSPSQKQYLEQIAQFEVPKEYKDNQIARHVSQLQFKNKEFLLSLASEAEGFRSKIYNDNIGFAFGNGWNISMQKSEYNEKLAKSISQDPLFIKKISSLSGKVADYPISGDFHNITISPQRSMQIVGIMSYEFKNGVLKHLEKEVSNNPKAQKIHKETGKTYSQITDEMFSSLAPNEQSALVYHAYKVGQAGFGKYKGLISEVVNYGLSSEKSLDSKKAIAEHFTYKYKMNGEIKEDIRASTLVASMFLDTEAFGYIIGKNVAPKNISNTIPQFNKYKINTNASSGEVSIPDPVGDYRKEIEAKGGKIDIRIIPEDTDMINSITEKMRNNSNKKGVPSYWY